MSVIKLGDQRRRMMAAQYEQAHAAQEKIVQQIKERLAHQEQILLGLALLVKVLKGKQK